MKQIHSSRMVAHLWANQSQPSARNGRGSLFFNGDTIYSYGSHFPIARHVRRNGEGAVLFTTRGYSHTTAGHKCAVERSLSNGTTVFSDARPVFHVANIYGTPGDCLKDYKSRLQELAIQFAKARSNKPCIARQMLHLVQEANCFAEFFGLKSKLPVPSQEQVDAALVAEEQRLAKRKEEEQQRLELLVKESACLIEQWKAGDPVTIPWAIPDICLRIKGEMVETSRGAEVPLEQAKRILPLIRSSRGYSHNGHSIHLGHFRVDAIDEQGNLRAGCHFIKREEIERVAQQLGL